MGDGRTTMALQRAAPLAQVDAHRRSDPAGANPKVFVKPFVFGRDNRVSQVFGHGISRHHAAKLIAAPSKDIAFAVKHGN